MIDTYRRNLQRGYLDIVDDRLNGSGRTSTDLGPVLLGSLRDLRGRLNAALPKVTEQMTRLHLEASIRKIDEILMPRPPVIVTTAPAAGGGFRGPGG
jgi:hypothetical protein